MTAVATTHQELQAAISAPGIDSIVHNSLHNQVGQVGSESALLARKEVLAMLTTKTLVPAGTIAIALFGGAVALATPSGSGQANGDAIQEINGTLLAQFDDLFDASNSRTAKFATSPAQRTDVPTDLNGADDGSPISAGDSQTTAQRPAKAPAKRRLTGAQRISAELQKETNIDLLEAPLREVVEYLQELHGIQIQLDNRSLLAAGIDSNIPISRNVSGIPLGSALGLILEEIDLDYMIRHNVLLITSKERVENTVETHVYPTENMDAAALSAVLRKTIRPATWIDNAIAIDKKVLGTIQIVSKGLVIRQSSPAHREIAELIQELGSLEQNQRPARETPSSSAVQN